MNARALMNFLSLRVEDESAAYPSHPMREIEAVARQFEAIFAERMPVTHALFAGNGRVAP
jgi:thymidylate synthase (FAD)